jgi:hypothetical protein
MMNNLIKSFRARGNFGDRLRAPICQSLIKRFKFAVTTTRDMHRLSEQMPQNGTSCFTDRAEVNLSGN